MELKIDGFSYGGRAFGRLPSGKVCFVRGGAPGETVLMEMSSEKRSYCEGRLMDVLERSPSRIDELCPLAASNSCPGCSYQHVPYEMELEAKLGQLKGFLSRWLGVGDAVQMKASGSPLRYAWRNKLRLSCAQTTGGKIGSGYFAEDNKSLVELDSCPLAHPDINSLLKSELSRPAFRKLLRDGMKISLRRTERDGAVIWVDKPKPNDQWLLETLPQGDFLVPRGSFFQVNPHVAGELFARVRSTVSSCAPDFLFDIYCGVGAIAISGTLAGAGKTFGAELDAPAIDAAKKNAERLGAKNCEFMAGDASKLLGGLLKRGEMKRSLVVLDPPRSGLAKGMAETLAEQKPGRMLYVSCSPDTLCRDLKPLLAAGYSLRSTELFDMFPATAHFETLAFLELE